MLNESVRKALEKYRDYKNELSFSSQNSSRCYSEQGENEEKQMIMQTPVNNKRQMRQEKERDDRDKENNVGLLA